ncbi:Aste57867_20157 [Aphanomyces stellatus]|uniref:Aste57867_20157 protein n=1 Tax=Aphanomyces stellatus TaxID=120398 RepID=A0A485LEH8_9STRA|nr:hypothetical protein As57867_020091 [Aphanomyces stellatus]VFT96852.1 Aste57867_20157 [Aphanomyces stellatus]
MASSRLVVGTYTRKEDHVDGKGKGVYSISIDHASGKMTLVHVNDNTGVNPSFVNTTHHGALVFAVNEVADVVPGHPNGTGFLRSFSLDAHGRLTPQSEQPSHGSYPCHVVADPSNRFVAVSNYGGGSVALFPYAHGVLGAASSVIQMMGASHVNPQRQDAPHCHSSTWLSPTTLAVMDLGNDKVMQYTLDHDTGMLSPHASRPYVVLPPGSGPRHMDVHPTKSLAYVTHELANAVSVHSIDPTAGLSLPLQVVSLLPAGVPVGGANLAAEVRVSKCGHFVLASSRGRDEIVVFRITYPLGYLAAPTFVSSGGAIPRHFQLVGPDLVVVANQNGDSLVSFRLSAEHGLVRLGPSLAIPSPVCVQVVE